MLKKRAGIWAIFLIACLLGQLLVTTVPSMVVTIKQWTLDAKLDSIIKEHEAEVNKPVVAETQPPDVTVGDDTQSNQEAMSSALGTMIEIVSNISRYIGIMVVIYAMFALIMGFRDENAEATARGVSMAVVGGVLVGFSAIVPMILNGMSG